MPLKIKPGASLQGLNIKMRPAIIEAGKAYEEYGQDLVITSGTDGEHSLGSLHYYGYAIDIRTKNLLPSEQREIFNTLIKKLHNLGYVLIFHKTHIHIEYRRILDGISKIPN